MKAPLVKQARVDRSVIRVCTLDEADKEDKEYWWSRTPEERLAALEQARQLNYGYDPASKRLRRFFEVVEFTPR